LKRNRSFV